jgi:hypothetical protein
MIQVASCVYKEDGSIRVETDSRNTIVILYTQRLHATQNHPNLIWPDSELPFCVVVTIPSMTSLAAQNTGTYNTARGCHGFLDPLLWFD